MDRETPNNCTSSPLNTSSHHAKLSSPSPIPSLKVKKSQGLGPLPEFFIPKTAIRTIGARRNVYKKPSVIPLEAVNSKSSYSTNKISVVHKRSDSATHATSVSKKIELGQAGYRREATPEVSNKTTIEKPNMLRDLLKPANIFKKTSTPGSMFISKVGMSSYSLLSGDSRKNMDRKSMKIEVKDSQEMAQKCIDSINKVVFSDNRNRFAVYQKRFFALKEQPPQQNNLETLFTPKVNKHKTMETPTKSNKKVCAIGELQLLREALSQQLNVKSPLPETPEPGNTKLSRAIAEKNENGYQPQPVRTGSKKKRESTGSFMSPFGVQGEGKEAKSPSKKESLMLLEQILASHLPGKEAVKVSKEDEAKVEEGGKSEENSLYYTKLLEVDKQTFDFERMIAAKMKTQKERKKSMFISVASPSSRKEITETSGKVEKSEEAASSKGRETPFMFSLYAKEHEAQVPTLESIKNGQGSTSCSSSKITKDTPSIRKEEKHVNGFGEAVKVVEYDTGKTRKKSRVVSKANSKIEG